MRQQAWCAARPGAVRAYVLLVLAVLAGVVAMHGLGPAVPLASPSAVPDVRHAVTAGASSHTDPAECEDCIHVGHDEGGVGGHAEHADATCAAGGTSGAPALPALALAVVVTCPTAEAPAVVPAATLGGRAPPSLSELQLLRI
ncbi:hypothetical protein J7E96_30975 [Streptomyces sp. ISL-96]|uniref:DUF6153 family protein n=1 Tax=Streptomyces sp. ISL-96 TaxID=2819191 RepID=UPI001BEC571F|nr:DUF6153 family protein [Streptomyces sp. ISL-96]MBT2492857.1 hypothetical protein [Streptomyces sp. ISL-96]